MIVAQPLEVVVERVEARGGEDPGLPHRSTQHASVPDAARDELLRSREERSARRAQALGKRHADEVEGLGEVRELRAGRSRDVPEGYATVEGARSAHPRPAS